MGRGTDRALAVSRGWIPPSDGGTRRRGKPRRGASRVRAVPAASRGGARRVSVAGDRLDLPCTPGGTADIRSNDAGRRADGRTRYVRALASPDGGSTAPGGAGSRATVAEAPRSPSLCAHRRDRCRRGGSAHGVRSRWKREAARPSRRPATRWASSTRARVALSRTPASAQHPRPSRPAKVRIGSPTPRVTRCRGSTLERPPSSTRSRSATARAGSRPAPAPSGWSTASTAQSRGSTPARTPSSTRSASGNEPLGIVYAAGSVWVANTGDNTITRIDPDSGRPTETFPVAATELAFGAGTLWASQPAAGQVVRIDPATGKQVGSIQVGNGPTGIAFGQRLGVGDEQPGRDGLPDRSRHELGHRDRRHRERARRGGHRLTRHLGEQPVRRQRRADRSHQKPGGAASERGKPPTGIGDLGRRSARRRPSPGRRPSRRDARAAL